MSLSNPLASCPVVAPARTWFVRRTMELATVRKWTWAKLEAKAHFEDYGAEYNLPKRLRGDLPLLPAHIERLADAFGLTEGERERFLVLGYLCISPPALLELLERVSPSWWRDDINQRSEGALQACPI